LRYIVYFIIPLSLVLLATPLIIHLARRYNCVDNPGKRRFHKLPTPRWGGLAFSIGVLPILLFLQIDRQLISYIIASLILIIIGGIDDWKPIGWKIKLLGIIMAITIIIFIGNIVIRHIGSYGSLGSAGPIGKIWLSNLSIPFTYLSIIGVTNAINLIDGLNGLSGGVSLIAFLFIGVAAYFSGNYPLAIIAIAFAGALLGFLRYNYPNAKIFMGDSGSLFLGFSLAIFSIMLTQDESSHIEAMFPVMVLLIPIFDTLRVMLLRALRVKNPFKADKIHLHHLFVRRGFPPTKTVLLFWSLTIVFGLIATMMINNTFIPYIIVALSICAFLSLLAESMGRSRRYKKSKALGAGSYWELKVRRAPLALRNRGKDGKNNG